MILAIFGYSLFFFYVIMVVAFSAMCWLAMGLGVGIFVFEDHKSDADWRPVAVVVFLVGLVLQWALLKTANVMVPNMWHSLPSISFF